ncbi:MAG: ATP synthase F1 subunit gamma [bacterium]|nr:ATP synthase F1 subunit gamma [bacterium]
MAFLIEVKKKIGSVQNTRKITQAMQLVAASKMKFFQHKAVQARTYAWHLLDGLRLSHSSLAEQLFAEQRTVGTRLFVLVTSDKGLCGSLNQQLIRTLFRSELWKKTPKEERLLITIGRKSYDAASAAGIPVHDRIESIPEALPPLEALGIIERILAPWNDRSAKEIILVAPHYVNPFTFYPTIKTYLPLSSQMVQSHLLWKEASVAGAPEPRPATEEDDTASEILFEPERERLLETLTLQILHTIFLGAFYELKACEYSSRMVAMKKATESADELVKSLTRDYHKARQAVITQQLAELAGAENAITS